MLQSEKSSRIMLEENTEKWNLKGRYSAVSDASIRRFLLLSNNFGLF